MAQIFKVQMPINASEPRPYALIYTKGKENYRQIPISEPLTEKMRGELKLFLYGEIVDGQFIHYHEAPWQEW